jgi:L-lysine 6-transaminase
VKRDGLVQHAARMGDRLVEGLRDLGRRHQDLVGNVRGRGLMCAFDLPDGELRDDVVRSCLDHGLIILKCGTQSVRFRPALTIEPGEIDQALERIDATLGRLEPATREAGPSSRGEGTFVDEEQG